MKKLQTLLAVVAVATAALTPTAAQADTFAVSADRTSNLAIAGENVSVTVSGIPADRGVYVRLCAGTLAEASVARPANCFGQGSWVSLSSVAQQQGAGDASKPVVLAVIAKFTVGSTAVDCTVQACGIHVRRDHMGGATDYSLDRFIPVTFGAAALATTKGSYKVGKVTFEIVGQNGKLLSFKYGNKTVVKKATSDDYKVTFVVTGRAKTISVIVKADNKTLLARKLLLDK